MAQKTAPRRIDAAERRTRAIDLRREGRTYEEIGSTLGVTRQRAYQIVERYMEELRRECAESARDIRDMELERLDRMTSRLWPEVELGDLGAMDMTLKVMARRAKLLGLDAPAKLAPTNPAGDRPYGGYSDAELVDLVRKIAEQHADADPE